MEQLKKVLKWTLAFVFGLVLFWLVYRKMDLSSMMDIFKQGLHIGWIGLYVLLFILPMVLRGIRWKQLIDPIASGCKLYTSIMAVFIAYGANLIFPRIGEVARCGILKKYNGLSFSKTLGTVITERVFDILCLLLMAIAAIVLQLNVFRHFLEQNPQSGEKILNILLSWKVWAAVIALALLVFTTRKRLRRTAFYAKFKDVPKQLWEGMRSIKTIKHPWLFILLTLCIWIVYFASFYIAQYILHIPLGLSVLAMFTAHIMGTFGVVAPVQGGIGAWHFMVIYTLVFYGIPELQAGSFALIAHGLTTIMTAVFGLSAYFLVRIKF